MGSVAVCCGFNYYEHVSSLSCALNDAVHPYAELTKNRAFHADPSLARIGRVFTQKTTSADEVLAAFASAAGSAADLVWFSFSGHAVVSETGELRLLLPEWRPDDDEVDRRRRSIGACELERVMRPHLARKRFVVVLDACFTGGFGGAAVTRDIAPSSEDRIASAGAVVISACAKGQLAADVRLERPGANGAFTSAMIEVIRERGESGASLSVFELFLETKRKIKNGQLPTLYANGLTEDFTILAEAGPAEDAADIVRVSVEVPRKIESELASFLKSVVRIARNHRVGLADAERQLQRLAGEFDRYGDAAFVVAGTNANVVEAFEMARECVVGCTTQPYFDEWHRGGMALLTANEQFIQKRGGRVIRFFFVQDDFQDRVPGAVNVIRDQLKAGIRAVIVHVDSFGSAVMQAVFNDPSPRDLSSLECAFVDGKIFLKVHFIAHGNSKIEIDQGRRRCQYEYKTLLQPFLSSSHGRFFGASIDPSHDDKVVFSLLRPAEVAALRCQLERDLAIEIREPWPVRRAGGGG